MELQNDKQLIRRHVSRPERDFTFDQPHDKRRLPTLNFLSGFLSDTLFAHCYTRSCGRQRANPTRKTKTPAKKFCLPAFASCTGLFILTMLFSVDTFAQNNSFGNLPLSQRAIEQIEKNMVNSSDWHRLNELKMLNANFPSLAYQQQINALYEQYRFTLVGLEFEREKQEWQIQQQNLQQMQKFGHQPPPKQEEMKVDYYDKQAIIRQQKMKELYEEINSINNSYEPADPIKLEELEKVKRKLRVADTNSVDYKNYIKYYNEAYNELVNMLSGKTALNLKRAVFVVENAYHKNKLNYEKYCKQIDNLVFICKQIMKEKGLDLKNYMACHYTIQRLFAEKFIYKNDLGQDVTFEPFGYDFIDIFGDNDQTKGFVTKLLNTKIGQCHSMPLLYLILAEELNANAYLALAPNHSYVKFGNQYQAFGFETTNGTFTSDEWIVASGYISPTAIKNQIYLAPLTKEKVIAECLIDLEEGMSFLFGKSNFSIKCSNATLKYFPNSIRSILTISNVLVAECAQSASKYKFPKEADYVKYPNLKKQFDEMVEYETAVEQTGYMRIPQDQYEKWQQTANEEKQRREHLKLLDKLKEYSNEK